MNAREIKGRELADHGRIERHGTCWRVGSQSGNGWYVVDVDSIPPSCSCPDYELRGLKCKHVYAVEYTVRCEKETRTETVSTEQGTMVTTTTVTETTTATVTAKRVTYRQDWPAYNAAQTSENAWFQSLLADLCRELPDLPQQPGPGRPRLPLRDMVFAAAVQGLFHRLVSPLHV